MKQQYFLAAAAISASLWNGMATAAPQVQPTDRVETAVNVRSAPTADSARLDRLEPGEALQLHGEVPGWYRVRLPGGRTGYVSKAWTNLSDIASAAASHLVHAVDLGTGLAIFVEGPDFTLLYDGGSNDDTARGNGNRLLAYLRHVRPDLTTIDHIILSHPHRDHVELLPDVLATYAVRNVWDSGRLHPICGYRAFLTRVQAEPGVQYHDAHRVAGPHVANFGAARCYGMAEPARSVVIPHASAIQPGAAVPLGRVASMTFLHADADDHHSPNENSLVLRLDVAGKPMLLMGDAEAGGREDPSLPPNPDSIEGRLLACCSAALRADVLVVGHHGSKTSSRRQFLDAVRAGTFIVSAGPTRYGSVTLPDAVIVSELERRGAVYRTDSDDAGCRADSTKIGPDNDNKPGGCDNVMLRIPAAGPISATYVRVAD